MLQTQQVVMASAITAQGLENSNWRVALQEQVNQLLENARQSNKLLKEGMSFRSQVLSKSLDKLNMCIQEISTISRQLSMLAVDQQFMEGTSAYMNWLPEEKHESSNMEQLLMKLQNVTTPNYKNRFLVKSRQKLLTVNVDEIALFYTKNKVCFLVTKDLQKYIVDYSLEELELQLDPSNFFRANRKFLVAHDVISSVSPWFNGKLILELQFKLNEEEIIISRERSSLFKTWMGG